MIEITTVLGKTYTVKETTLPFYLDQSQEWLHCTDTSGKEVRINRHQVVSFREVEAPTKKRETKVKDVEVKE